MSRISTRERDRRAALARAYPPEAERRRIDQEWRDRQAQQRQPGTRLTIRERFERQLAQEERVLGRVLGRSVDGLEWARRAAVKQPARSQGPQVYRQPWLRKFAAVVGARQGEDVDGLWPDRREGLTAYGVVVAGPDTDIEEEE
jgi:hypothetical protein